MTSPDPPIPPGDPPPERPPSGLPWRPGDVEEMTRRVLDLVEAREAQRRAGIPWWKSAGMGALRGVTTYWFLASVLVFVIACLFLKASPFYPFKQISVADQELDRKERRFKYEQDLSGHFVKLGKRLLDIGKYRDAAKAYEEALRLDKANCHARFGLYKARLLDPSEAGEFDAEVIARRIDAVLERLGPGCKDMSGAKDRKSAGDKTGEPSRDSHALAARAQLLFDIGDKKGAGDLWREALEKNSELAQAHFGLGVLLSEARQYGEAARAFDGAARQAPFNWEYRNNLASALVHAGDYKKAMTHFQRLFEMDRDALLPHMEGARALLFMWRLTDALNVLNRLIQGLEDPALRKLAKNGGAWFFPLTDRDVALSGYGMKQAYAHSLRGLVCFLKKMPKSARRDLEKSHAPAANKTAEVKDLLENDLDLLEQAQPAASKRIEAFRKDYLSD
ncbi:MAG: tetratricopeptide repeat protein [Desulfobacterales bacterium]|nr:tetratricopeptide repeat protein [Desulfobacterales bacterium]